MLTRAYPGADGCHELGRGALFPTNYAIRPVAPQYICPVRDCRRLMRSILALGGHFSAKHCYTKFNDNLDGTLSVVARYKNSNTSPAIVVSRNRPAPDAPPAVEPSLPIVTAAQKRRRLELGLSVSEPSTPAPVRTPLITSITSDIPTPSPPPPPKDGLPSHVCRYLHGFLSGKQEIPSRGDVQYMIRLPKRRAMPECWIQRHQGERLVVSIYAVSLAYLVGDEVKGADACPQTYQQAGRLSSPCIVLPSAMPESLKRIFFKLPTCLGCFYRCTTMRQRNICSYTLEAQAQAQAQAQAEVALSGVAAAPGRVGPGLAKEGPARVSKKEVGDDKAGEESDGSTAQTLASASASTRSRARPLKRRATDANVNHAPKAIKLSVESAERPESMLEMESWEMAPGRVTEESGNESACYYPPACEYGADYDARRCLFWRPSHQRAARSDTAGHWHPRHRRQARHQQPLGRGSQHGEGLHGGGRQGPG